MDKKLPVIDIAPLFGKEEALRLAVARAIAGACRDSGFFYVTGHGIEGETLAALERESRAFFALPLPEKQKIAMALGGPAWRGFFPLGDELTSGRPDAKEGIYFGSELAPEHPRVREGWPLHGPNLWPERPAALRPAVEAYMAGAARAGHAMMEGISLSLGLPADYFAKSYTAEPTILFRIFHYPARWPEEWGETWGAGAHSDYGLLTLLAQDANGGLEVKSPGGWVQAPPLPGALVCNIGDMLEKLTGGLYRSTLHRVLNRSGRDRLSFPLFFDPDFAAEIRPLPEVRVEGEPEAAPRWDGLDLKDFQGCYGDYLLGKVAKVFPDLGKAHLGGEKAS